MDTRTAILHQLAETGDLGIDDLIRRTNLPEHDVRDEVEILAGDGLVKVSRMGRHVALTLPGRQAAHVAGAAIPSPLVDAEHLLAHLAQIGDGDERGRHQVRSQQLETDLGWSTYRLRDAADLLDANGLAKVHGFIGHFIVELTAHGRRAAA